MKNQIKKFSQFVNEEEDFEKVTNDPDRLDDLTRLAEIGMISKSELMRELMKDLRPIMREKMVGSESRVIQGVNTLGMFLIDGMDSAGKIEFVNLDEEGIRVDFPDERTDDWDTEYWHIYVCEIAKENGIDTVYFPEDGVVVQC
jgi:hypothetical protein